MEKVVRVPLQEYAWQLPTDFTGYYTALYDLPGLCVKMPYRKETGVLIHQEL